MAREERAKHMQKYPGWTARDNYAINKKKKRKRDKSLGTRLWRVVKFGDKIDLLAVSLGVHPF